MLYFSPTYLIEKFGLNKYENFQKLFYEIIDKQTGVSLKYAHNPRMEYDPIMGCLDEGCDLISQMLNIRYGKLEGAEDFALAEPGFKFELGRNYVVNLYRNGSYNKNDLVVSCEVTGEWTMPGTRYYDAVSHPAVPNIDYYEHFGLKPGFAKFPY